MSSFCAPKISDVLQTLSEQPDFIENYENAWAVARSSDDRSKQVFTDAVNYCMVLLRKTNRITEKCSEVLSDEATLMGHEMFERLINIDVQMDVESEDEGTTSSIQQRIKMEPEDYFKNVTIHAYSLATELEETSSVRSRSLSPSQKVRKDSESSSSAKSDLDIARPFFSPVPEVHSEDFDDKHFPPSPVSLSEGDDTVDVAVMKRFGSKLGVAKNLIPLEIKMKVVALSRAHPTWSLATLQRRGSTMLRTMEQLRQWEKQIDNGGTLRDKYMRINNWTYERFVEARVKNQRVSTKMLRQWALQAARDFYDSSINFDAGKNWCLKFKKVYGLHGGAMHGYFMRDEPPMMTAIEELRRLEKHARDRAGKGRASSRL